MACDCLRHVNDGLAQFNAHVAIALIGTDPQALVKTHYHGPEEAEIPYFLVAAYCPFCGECYAGEPAIGRSSTGEVSSHVH